MAHVHARVALTTPEASTPAVSTRAVRVQVRGVVQGVGFRPFVFRLAQTHALAGWVLNGEDGVEIHLEGDARALDAFAVALRADPPPAAVITSIDVTSAQVEGFGQFTIRNSERHDRPTVRVSPDLPVCDDCLLELFDPNDARGGYAYINCTNCGPRYTIIEDLPYDRSQTTMRSWPMCARCAAQYDDPRDRRFHAQPVACPDCGPRYALRIATASAASADAGADADAGACAMPIRATARLLTDGRIVAIKGIGGYHLACDAMNAAAVQALRERKFRKERPFALMARDLAVAREVIDLSDEARALLTSVAKPIVLGRAKVTLAGVAPDNYDLGVMLPYAPLHHLLFAHGAPKLLVMTSANRSSEPIAYEDEDAIARLSEIADAMLIGERPIARRVDDSIVRVGACGPVVLRRARGYAPAAVATFPAREPVLAVGADLKNSVALVVDGQAFVSQHLGDLDDFRTQQAFQRAIADLLRMYDVSPDTLIVAHDAHPEYRSTVFAQSLPAKTHVAAQHHRAHIASVLAEHAAWEARVIGVSFDGTGYGDDGSIWGGEILTGSLRKGFTRRTHLRPAWLPGGDAAARHPVQAAAGFLSQLLEELGEPRPDFSSESDDSQESAHDGQESVSKTQTLCHHDVSMFIRGEFAFPRFAQALALVRSGVRTFRTTSMGRLFDTVAALLGFTREMTFEGQAAIWLEQLARSSPDVTPYPFPYRDGDGHAHADANAAGQLDFVPLLAAVIRDRLAGRAPTEIARAFHAGVAAGVCDAVIRIARADGLDTVVLSGGVFQNDLLLHDIKTMLDGALQLWTNHAVPPNDGGISLGQAALAALAAVGAS